MLAEVWVAAWEDFGTDAVAAVAETACAVVEAVASPSVADAEEEVASGLRRGCAACSLVVPVRKPVAVQGRQAAWRNADCLALSSVAHVDVEAARVEAC